MVEVTPSGTALCHATAVLCPIIMAHLAQRPGTKLFRMALYPIGVLAAVTSVIRMGDAKAERKQASDTSDSFLAIFANFLLIANLSLVGRFAFSNEVYRPHPLPRRPAHLADWRQPKGSWARTIDIILSFDRKINYPPNPPLKPIPKPPSRWQSIIRCVKWVSIYSILVDFFTLWPPLLSRYGLYHPDGSRDLTRFCEILSLKFGLPAWMFRAWFTVCYAGTVMCGMQGGWEEVRGLAIGSGIWLEEEWPDLMRRPYLATSMIDLWGRRYHQLLRSTFDTLLHPFHLPKPLYLLAAFTISGFYHVLVMYPVLGEFAYHYLFFFISCGLVCLVERTIYGFTGKKVSGVLGWVWTWAWIFVLGSWSLESEINAGQLEGFRAPAGVGGYSLYPLDYVVEYLGWAE